MKVMVIAALAVLLGAPVPGVSADAPYNAAQRQAQIDRVRDGLNSPDPTKRLVTLEQAVATKDRTLRRVALSTAFASADSDLRSAALGAAVASSATFVVDITNPDPANTSHWITARLGASFEVRIERFDAGRNAFEASSSSSLVKANGAVQSLFGAVSGDRLSFDVNIGRVFSANANSNQCRGVARLQGGSPLLRGSLNCVMQLEGAWTGSNHWSENYAITIDMLK
jgi:hypothetical protein